MVKEGCGLSWDGVCLAVAMPQSTTPYLEKSDEEWEELCQEYGFEYVDFERKGRNEFSEPLGVERLKEALETNDWEGLGELDDALGLDEFDDGVTSDDEGSIGFGISKAEVEADMKGMKQAIYSGGLHGNEDGENAEDDDEVEKLQSMIQKMQAVKGRFPKKFPGWNLANDRRSGCRHA